MNFFIQKLSEIGADQSNQALEQARKIFYQSSTRTHFADRDEKAQFEFRYFGVYCKNPQQVFLAFSNESVIGYLVGTEVTTPEHYQLNPYLESFKEIITQKFPAHLHINLSPETRGKGVGSRLLESFEAALRERNIPGVHLVTSSSARNLSFYERNHYRMKMNSETPTSTLVLMGKALNSLS